MNICLKSGSINQLQKDPSRFRFGFGGHVRGSVRLNDIESNEECRLQLDDVGAEAVVRGLVDKAPADMHVEVKAFVAIAVIWVRRVRSLLTGMGVFALVAASLPLPGAAAVSSLRSIRKGRPSTPVASQLTTPPSGGVAAASSSGLPAAYDNAGRRFSNLDVRAVSLFISASAPPLTYEGLFRLPGFDLLWVVSSALSGLVGGKVEQLPAVSHQAAGVMQAARERLILPAGYDANQVGSWPILLSLSQCQPDSLTE